MYNQLRKGYIIAACFINIGNTLYPTEYDRSINKPKACKH
jgi:hypothetical protein